MKTLLPLISVLFTFWFFACQSEDDAPPAPAPLEAAFVANDTAVTQGSEVTFTDQSTGVDSTVRYRWSFSGGTPASFEGADPPAIAYQDTGRFDVTLQIDRDAQSDSETKTGYIIVQLDSATLCSEDPFACVEPVSPGSTFTDQFSQTNDANVYEVVVDSSGVLEVAIEDVPGNLSLVSELLSSDDTNTLLVRGENNAGRLYYELLVRPGTYYVVVRNQSNEVSEEDYRITITLDRTDRNEWNGSISTATSLVIGETATGTLRTREDADYFEINVEQPGVLDIRLSSVPEVRTGVELLDANGETLESTNRFRREEGDPAQLLYLTPQTGSYFIRLTGNASSPDSYQLTVTLDTRDVYEYNDRQNAQPIALDEAVRGRYEPIGTMIGLRSPWSSPAP